MALLRNLLLAALLAVPLASAAPPTEYEVKVGFIHNIAKFAEWPAARAGGSLRFCVAGQDPFGGATAALQGKPVGGLVWEVVPAGSRTNVRECQVLFIAASEAGNLRRLLDSLRGSPVLTVGDTAGFAEEGVIANFYLDQGRVRFEINPDAAGRAGLKLSSQLLKLARIVRDGGEAR